MKQLKEIALVLLACVVCVEAFFLIKLANVNSQLPISREQLVDERLLISLKNEIESLKKQIQSFESKDRLINQRNDDLVAQDPLVEMSAVTELVDRGFLKADLPFLGPEGKLSEGFIELYRLTNSEVEQIQVLIDGTKDALIEETKRNTVVTVADSGEIEVKIEPFVDQGSELYFDMLDNLDSQLGEERFDSMMTLLGSQIEREFGRFGASRREMSISRENLGDGEQVLSVREIQDWGEGEGTGSHWKEYTSVDQFYDDYKSLKGLIP